MTETKSQCCADEGTSEDSVATQHETRDTVRAGYAQIATAKSSGCGCGAGGCTGAATVTPTDVAAAIGYAKEDLSTLPDGANMGLGCGNPTALAALAPGEVVVDLGSGGGLDCFIAGQRVGPTGRVIGVDMTAEMLGKARDGLKIYQERSGLSNVEFRLGEIEHLPLPDASVDVVISNCVVNLSPDKQQVWHDVARVLKPGGRVAISDLALLQPLPDDVRTDIEALIGCIAGAELVDTTRAQVEAAGLTNIELNIRADYMQAMDTWQDPMYKRIAERLGGNVGEYVTSLEVRATKP